MCLLIYMINTALISFCRETFLGSLKEMKMNAYCLTLLLALYLRVRNSYLTCNSLFFSLGRKIIA